MKKYILLVGILVFISIFVGVFINKKCQEVRELRQRISELQDTNDNIVELTNDIRRNSVLADTLKAKKEKIKVEVKVISKAYEKRDSVIVNGSWKYQLDFFTRVLSEDSVRRKGYSSSTR
jgi:hypothetical protein